MTTPTTAEIDGEHIEAISCVREASRSIDMGLEMLYQLPAAGASNADICQAEGLMLRARERLQAALAMINNTPSNTAAQPAA